jgi:nucleoside-diphosphate-sugar epimerase
MNKKILITGAAGYVGSALIEKLVQSNFKIIAVDTFWFGDFIKNHNNIKKIKLDIRNYKNIPLKDIDYVIHLASIANDPCSDLNPKLSWEVIALATMKLIEECIKYKVKKFIYASSGSVYGLKKEQKVTEELALEPISDYNKGKMIAERVLRSYEKEINLTIVRPGTVYGISPRLRLDLTVNMFAYQAVTQKKITIFGGKQIRPSIHIDDLNNLYKYLIDNNIKGVFNAGFENHKIIDVANMIRSKTNCKIIIQKSNDVRSYRLNSDKIKKTGFKPKITLKNSITEIIEYLKINHKKFNESNYNLKWMIKKKIL